MDSVWFKPRLEGSIIERTHAQMASKKANKRKRRKAAKSARKNTATAAESASVAKESKPARDRKGRPKVASTPLERQLRKTVAELGLSRARKIFASFEEAFGD